MAKDLCISLLKVEEEKRLGYGKDGPEKIKEHPFFSSIKFDSLFSSPVPEDTQEASPQENTISYATISSASIIPDYFASSPQPASSSQSNKILKGGTTNLMI